MFVELLSHKIGAGEFPLRSPTHYIVRLALHSNMGLVIFRCASISCTDDRLSLIETADWQSLMFDSYFTIRLVQSRL